MWLWSRQQKAPVFMYGTNEWIFESQQHVLWHLRLWRRQMVEMEKTGDRKPDRGAWTLTMGLGVTDLNDSPKWDPYLLSSGAKGCSTSTVREARAETVSVSSCNWAPARAQPLGTATILTDFQYLPRKKHASYFIGILLRVVLTRILI